MRFKLSYANFKASIVDANGNTILNYEINNVDLDANITGLVQAGLAIKSEIESAIASEEVQQALRDAASATSQ